MDRENLRHRLIGSTSQKCEKGRFWQHSQVGVAFKLVKPVNLRTERHVTCKVSLLKNMNFLFLRRKDLSENCAQSVENIFGHRTIVR